MNAVELIGVQQRYGALQALHHLDLSLGEGEVLGLFGHNGAGKTTTMKLILGLLQPSQGQVKVLGGAPGDAHIRRMLGYLPENVTFYPQLTGRETLRHFARLKDAPIAQIDELLEQVGLIHAAERRVKTYSKGMRQRLGLAQALLGAPRLLLLDEPTVGLDPIATQSLYQVIDGLRQQGTSIILCSHVLPGVERHIDRALILAGGKMQAIGDLASLRAEAGLPTLIRASGLNGAQHWQAKLAQAGHQATAQGDSDLEVITHNGHKLPLLRELLGEGLNDLEVHQPSLEDLYCYYMKRAGQTDAAGESA